MSIEVDDLKINYRQMNFSFYRDGQPLDSKLNQHEMMMVVSALLFDVVFAFDLVALNKDYGVNQREELVSFFKRLGYGKLKK